jgi:hypothetical protein
MDHSAGHALIEQLAAAILVIGGALFVGLSYRSRPVRPGPAAARSRLSEPGTARPTVSGSLVAIMAWLSAGAAVIHLVAAPSHVAEIGDLAAGFVAAALFQAAWIRWCLGGPSRRTILIGIAGNGAIVVAWALTRTIGLPIGALAGRPEPVGYPDAASVVFELLLIACLTARALGIDVALSARAKARTVAEVALVPVVGVVLLLTSLATLAIASGLEHGLPAVEHVAGH